MKRFTFFLLIITGITVFSAAQTAGLDMFYQEGIASWYGAEFDGKPTASGEIFDAGLLTAAHPTLPFGTILTVTNKQNMRQVTVRVNDRGPFVAARIVDLSRAAAEALDMIVTGTAPVILEPAGSTARNPAAVAPPAAFENTTYTNPVVPPAQFSPVPPPAAEVEYPAPLAAPVPVVAPVAAPAPVAQAFYPAPPAEIKGGIPPAESGKLYRLQVGAYKVPRNAVDAFTKLKNAGLNPAYEQAGELYRVVLGGLGAAEIQPIARILGNAGFREALIREETGY